MGQGREQQFKVGIDLNGNDIENLGSIASLCALLEAFDSNARAAQLGRVAPAGSPVMLTAESAIDYGTFNNGAPIIEPTGCVVGKGARFVVGAAAQAPDFSNVASGKPYKFLGATYASGKAFSYSLYVCVDRIEVIILAE
jgi:hypothetical protein